MSREFIQQYASQTGEIVKKPGIGILFAAGAGAPTAAAIGYAPGCIYIDHSGAAAYINTGSAASATWAAITHA